MNRWPDLLIVIFIFLSGTAAVFGAVNPLNVFIINTSFVAAALWSIAANVGQKQ